jgi:hypothetical protein
MNRMPVFALAVVHLQIADCGISHDRQFIAQPSFRDPPLQSIYYSIVNTTRNLAFPLIIRS